MESKESPQRRKGGVVNLNQLKKDMDPSKVRTGLKKLSIKSDYNKEERMEIWKKRKGFEIKWSMRVPVKSVERIKCDMGHFHEVEQDYHWVLNYTELSFDDAAEIVKFLGGDL